MKLENQFSLSYQNLILNIIFLCLTVQLSSQEKTLFFHKLTTEDNLTSQNLNYYLFKDQQGFIWISSVEGLNLYNGKDIRQFTALEKDSSSLLFNVTTSPFFEDKKENVWFSTVDCFEIYNRKNDNFQQKYINRNGDRIKGFYYLLYFNEEDNDLWVRVQDSLYVLPEKAFDKPNFIGKYHLNIWSRIIKKKEVSESSLLTPLEKGVEWRKFEHFSEISTPDTVLSEHIIRTIYYDEQEDYIWFGTDKGLIQFNLLNKKYQLFSIFKDESLKKIKAIVAIDSTYLIIGTQNQGLFYFNRYTKQFTAQVYQFNGFETSPFKYPIDGIYIDRDNIIWISTSGRGVFFANLESERFETLLEHKEGEFTEMNSIQSITEDKRGNIWSLTQNGVFKLSFKNGKYIDQKKYFPFATKYPYSIYCDAKNTIWVSDVSGLFFLKENDKRFKKVNINNATTSPIGFFFTRQLSDDKLLISSSKGIFYNDTDNNEKGLKRIDGLKEEDSKATFSWIQEQPKTKKILLRKLQNSFLIGTLKENYFIQDTVLIFKPTVNYLYWDETMNRHWLATSEGLYWIEKKENSYQIIKDTILKGQAFLGILREDNSDNLWLSSNRGIIKYNFKTGKQKSYGVVDGLQSNEFNFYSAHKTRNGKMIFGGVNGINIFDPKEIKDNLKPVNPTITSILINDAEPKQKLKCSETDALNVSLIKKLDVDQDNNTLSFRFAALDYVNPDANQFKYRMIGVEKDWTPPKTENFARYPNLPPGDYTFEVDATNSDGIWSNNPAQLRITVHPPWYQSNLAYGSYGLLTLLILFALYNFQLNQRLKEAEAHRLKELDNLKTALYTNITHEFRTPLTVIMGMANQIAEKPREWQQQGLQMIQRSGQNLLNLVNQMLDLAKIEAGSMQAKYAQGNIILYLQYLVESYHSYAAAKNINLVFYKEVEGIVMDYDADKLKTVITNLISNAVKFTPEKGKIIVHANLITIDQTTKKGGNSTVSFCQIKIRDNGIGIAEDKLPHVFDRFYQVEEASNYSGGTGVGLALTKELIELMEGQIMVNSRLNSGSEFVILLPFRQTAPFVKDEEGLAEKLMPISAFNATLDDLPQESIEDESLPLVLLIEDNLDVITYLQACLMDRYRIIIALDGQAGIDKALEHTPDLIISDVMMPEKDGFEVCAILKEDERSSHIPIILLTARVHIEDKITGLSKGADAYLGKPFHQKELEIRLEQLLLQRKRLQTYFAQQILASTETASPKAIAAPIESAFLKKVEQVIEDDLMADLDLDQICQLLLMSRSQVYRKIKALTGYSTTIFIRRIRLKHAYQLLTTTDKTVSEVAYAVGFKDPSFFSRSFSEVFQKSPTEVKAK